MNPTAALVSALLGLATLGVVSGQARWNNFNSYNGGNSAPAKLGPPQAPSNNAARQGVSNNPQPISPWGKLFTGIVGGMAEQIISVCPNICENILDQFNTINPEMVSMVRMIFPCTNICSIADNFVNSGVGMMANMVSRMG